MPVCRSSCWSGLLNTYQGCRMPSRSMFISSEDFAGDFSKDDDEISWLESRASLASWRYHPET